MVQLYKVTALIEHPRTQPNETREDESLLGNSKPIMVCKALPPLLSTLSVCLSVLFVCLSASLRTADNLSEASCSVVRALGRDEMCAL